MAQYSCLWSLSHLQLKEPVSSGSLPKAGIGLPILKWKTENKRSPILKCQVNLLPWNEQEE